MRSKLGSILLGTLLAIFVVATFAASYFGSTTHSDAHANARVCKNQAYLLSVVDDLAQTARVLVQNDMNLDPAVQHAFVKHYNLRHRQIQLRIHHQVDCNIPTTQG